MAKLMQISFTDQGEQRFYDVMRRVQLDEAKTCRCALGSYDVLSAAIVDRGATVIIREADGTEQECSLAWLRGDSEGTKSFN